MNQNEMVKKWRFNFAVIRIINFWILIYSRVLRYVMFSFTFAMIFAFRKQENSHMYLCLESIETVALAQSCVSLKTFN